MCLAIVTFLDLSLVSILISEHSFPRSRHCIDAILLLFGSLIETVAGSCLSLDCLTRRLCRFRFLHFDIFLVCRGLLIHWTSYEDLALVYSRGLW